MQIEFARLTKAEPRIGRDLVTFLTTAYQFKQRADYAIGPAAAPITSAEAATALADAARFIETITKVLPPGLTPPRGPSAQPLHRQPEGKRHGVPHHQHRNLLPVCHRIR